MKCDWDISKIVLADNDTHSARVETNTFSADGTVLRKHVQRNCEFVGARSSFALRELISSFRDSVGDATTCKPRRLISRID